MSRRLLLGPTVPTKAKARATTSSSPNTISAETARRMARSVGIPDSTPLTAQLLMDALAEVRAENAETAAVPSGFVTVPADELAELEAQAAAPRELFLEQHKLKYPPESRDAWAREYDRDPEGTAAYFAKAPVHVSRVAEAAAAGRPMTAQDQAPPSLDEVRESAVYKNWSVGRW